MSDTNEPKKQTPDRSVGRQRPIGVHVLTEFEFCARAGLLAYETDREDEEERFDRDPLDYLPFWDQREINRQLNMLLDDLWRWFMIAVVITVVTCILIWLVNWWFAVFGGVLLVLAFIPIFRLWKPINILTRRRTRAEKAEPRMPDANSPKNETIDWWEIQRKGFAVSSYKEPLVDYDLGISGNPRKILRYQDMVIPVFLRLPGEIKRQHTIRIAAYCQLIERREEARSPYGLVMEKGSYAAYVIKNTSTAREEFNRMLKKARSIIRRLNVEGKTPSQPRTSSPCRRCRIGYPRVHRLSETELMIDGQMQTVYEAIGIDGRSYHSQCGDRYWWIPPHERADEKDLRRDREYESW